MIHDCAVLGLGLIGSAALRYLSASGMNVIGIGPAEPADWNTHQGVFASHYDGGRITRILDKDPIWATLAARSIAVYGEIEAQSGIRFHGAAGLLRVSADPSQPPGDVIRQIEAVGRQMAVDFVMLDGDGMVRQFPWLHFPSGSVGLWERGQAGYIQPRKLAEAQLVIAAAQGATLLRQTTVGLRRHGSEWQLGTDAGNEIRAQRVLVCAGAWASSLLPRPLAVDLQLRTVTLARVEAAEAQRLASTPSIIYTLANDPDLFSIYSNPPLPYPDGGLCFKIGGVLHQTQKADSLQAVGDWFRRGGDPYEAAALRRVLQAMVPGLAAAEWGSKPCVYTGTASGYPYIDQVDEGLFVAAGGCGSAAKSSNEIGRLGAALVVDGVWKDELGEDTFAARYAAD